MTVSMPSFSASRVACRGAAPPKAMSVREPASLPRSIACTRAAFAMFSSTTSLTAKAASAVSRFIRAPTSRTRVSSAAARQRGMLPPAKRSGSMRPSTTSESVTVGRSPPRA